MMEVFTLLVEVGRLKDDGLPDGALGAAFLVFAPADSEEDAFRETAKLMKEAGFNPLEVSNFGTIAEREREGYVFSQEELALAEEAACEEAVIVLDKQVIFDEDDKGVRN